MDINYNEDNLIEAYDAFAKQSKNNKEVVEYANYDGNLPSCDINDELLSAYVVKTKKGNLFSVVPTKRLYDHISGVNVYAHEYAIESLDIANPYKMTLTVLYCPPYETEKWISYNRGDDDCDDSDDDYDDEYHDPSYYGHFEKVTIPSEYKMTLKQGDITRTWSSRISAIDSKDREAYSVFKKLVKVDKLFPRYFPGSNRAQAKRDFAKNVQQKHFSQKIKEM